MNLLYFVIGLFCSPVEKPSKADIERNKYLIDEYLREQSRQQGIAAYKAHLLEQAKPFTLIVRRYDSLY